MVPMTCATSEPSCSVTGRTRSNFLPRLHAWSELCPKIEPCENLVGVAPFLEDCVDGFVN